MKRNCRHESYARELKEKAKENRGEGEKSEEKKDEGKKGHRRAMFAYSFRLMDLGTGMYLAWGSSMKSEKDAFEEAMRMLREVDVRLRSVRLDRYYSESMYMDYFDFDEDTKVYVIPKRNATLNGSWSEGGNDRVREEHDELPGGVLQEGEIRGRVLGR